MAMAKTGSCSSCGYSPVAFDAVCCPRCGAQNSSTRVPDRYAGRGMLIGIALGSITGGVYGWFTPEPGMEDKAAARAFAGALLGGIPGLIVGLFAGLIAMAVADLYSKLTGQRLEARAGGLVKAEIGDVYYCAVCRRQQSSITDIDCGSCGRRTVRWNSGRESEAVAQARWDDMNRAH